MGREPLNLQDLRHSGVSTTEVFDFINRVHPALRSADRLFNAVAAARRSGQLPPDLRQWLHDWRNMDVVDCGNSVQALYHQIDWGAVSAIAAIASLRTDIAALCDRLRTSAPAEVAELPVPAALRGAPAVAWAALNHRLLTEDLVHTVPVPVALARTTGQGFVATLVCTVVPDDHRTPRVAQDIRAQKPEIRDEFLTAIEDAFRLAHRDVKGGSMSGVWRLADWPADVPSIDGPSAGAAAYLAWRLCLEGKLADPDLIVLGQIGKLAEVERVSDVREKVKAIIEARPDIDTIVVTDRNLEEAADAATNARVDFVREVVAHAPGLWCLRLGRVREA